jgi:HSP20 family protein
MERFEIFRDLHQIKREFDRIFGDLSTARRPFSRISFLPGNSARQYPMVNLSENGNGCRVEALAPGLDPQTLDVSVTGNALTISGEKLTNCGDVKNDSVHRSERAAGKFIRTLDLPTHVDGENISASYSNGILSVLLPKAESAKPRRIAITEG